MSNELNELRKRIEVLEEEVAQLKKEQTKVVESPAKQQTEQIPLTQSEEKPVIVRKSGQAQKPPLEPTLDEPAIVAAKVKQDSPERPLKPEKPPFDLEQFFYRWLPRVFMFILLLGVLWGLKIATDVGLLSDALRLVGGYAATGFLFYQGMRYVRKGQKIFGTTLLGGVIAIGVLTTFAGHYLYHYFPATLALLIGIFYVALGVYMSSRLKVEVLTLFSAIAGFLLTFLLGGMGSASLLFFSYVLILFLSLFYVSIQQQHKYTFYITFILFHQTILAQWISNISDYDRWYIVVVVMIQHLAILFFYLWGKIPRHVFTETLLYTNFVFALGWLQFLHEQEQIWAYGLFALLYIVLTAYVYKQKDQLLTGVFSAISVLAIASFMLSTRPSDVRVTNLLLLISGTISIWLGLKFHSVRTLIGGILVYLFPAIIVLGTMNIHGFFSLEHGNWIVLLYSIVLIFYTLYDEKFRWLKGKRKVVDPWLIVGQLISLMYVMNLLQYIFRISYGEMMSHFSIRLLHIEFIVWIAVLCAMYLFAKWEHGKYLVHTACILYFILGLRVMFAPMDGYQEWNVFYFALFTQIAYTAILVLMLVALMKKRFYLQSSKLLQRIPTWAFLLQLVLFIFINKWYFGIASYYVLENEYLLLAHTALLFGFTFLSISIGRKFSWKAVKYVGVFLLFASIFKLFFIDLFSIAIFVRAILFIGVGIAGLMYSKTLIKQEPKKDGVQTERETNITTPEQEQESTQQTDREEK